MTGTTADQLEAMVAQLRDGSPWTKLTPNSRMTEDQVAENQRWRLLTGLAVEVSENGYWPATIADICRRAEVSKKTFYEHFSSKEDAFLAVYDLIDLAVDAMLGPGDHHDYSSAGAFITTLLTNYIHLLQQSPPVTEVLLFQPLSATPVIRERRIVGMSRYTQSLQRAFAAAREAGLPISEVPDDDVIAMLGGIKELCLQHIHRHGASDLLAVHPSLHHFATTLLVADSHH